MLTTLVVPTSGQAEVCGLDVVRRPVEVKRRIGVVSQHNTADTDLTVAENLELRGRYFGLSGPAARRRASELLAGFGLAERGRARARADLRLPAGRAVARAMVEP